MNPEHEEAPVCETCGDEGHLIGDRVDSFGEHCDDMQPCPDCQRETEPFERELELVDGRFDYGGEA